MNKALNKYINLVDFLADFLGEDAEIVLHDVADLENSIVAIRNNHISGRQVGGPATDLVLEILKQKTYLQCPYLANYKGKSKTGKLLKSATYFIKGDDAKVIGLLCINMDIEKLAMVKNYMDKLMCFNEVSEESSISETFSHSAQELTFESIYSVVNAVGIPPERMEQDEKIRVVEALNEKGVFLIKGAVSEAAAALKVSEPTIYRYLGKVKRS